MLADEEYEPGGNIPATESNGAIDGKTAAAGGATGTGMGAIGAGAMALCRQRSQGATPGVGPVYGGKHVTGPHDFRVVPQPGAVAIAPVNNSMRKSRRFMAFLPGSVSSLPILRRGTSRPSDRV